MTSHKQIEAQIIDHFAARGKSRVEAIRFLDTHASPHTLATIDDEVLRDLVVSYRAAVERGW